MGEGPLESFRLAGRTLFSFGLVKDAEGNLSTFDGSSLLITRTGCRLDRLEADDLIAGTAEGDMAGASTDLDVHRGMYAEHGPGAVAHCHPPGTVPEDAGPGEHGVYAFGSTLAAAAAEAIRQWRAG